jgi:hypothetical protein
MKTALGILPIVTSFALLAAHFLRASQFALVAICALFPVLLVLPRRWVARTMQLALTAGAIEWVLTLVLIAQERIALGLPYTRSALILAGVATFTLASAFAFFLPAMRKRYQLDNAEKCIP